MITISYRKKLEIVIEYLCSKMNLPVVVGDRAFRLFCSLPLGTKAYLPFPMLVYFVLKCIQLSKDAYNWTNSRNIELDPDVAELSSVLAERISDEAPSEQS